MEGNGEVTVQLIGYLGEHSGSGRLIEGNIVGQGGHPRCPLLKREWWRLYMQGHKQQR